MKSNQKLKDIIIFIAIILILALTFRIYWIKKTKLSHDLLDYNNLEKILNQNTDNYLVISTDKKLKDYEIYSLVSKIGEGGYGKVYLGHEIISGNFVAVKKVPKFKIDPDRWFFNPADLTRLPAEIAINLYFYFLPERSPNIGYMRNYLNAKEHYFILFNWVKNAKSIKDYLRLNLNYIEYYFILDIFIQVVDGLCFMHNHQVIHGDIKDENILIYQKNGKNIALIIDMGSADFYDYKNTLKLDYRGGSMYKSPNIVKGLKFDQKKQDVWAIGILFYLFLYKKYPLPKNYNPEDIKITFPKYNKVKDDRIQNAIRSALNPSEDLRPSIDQIRNILLSNTNRSL